MLMNWKSGNLEESSLSDLEDAENTGDSAGDNSTVQDTTEEQYAEYIAKTLRPLSNNSNPNPGI